MEGQRLKKVLHVGCGGRELPPWLTPCQETRVDLDPNTKPDVIANMTDLGEIGTFDMIYCSHALEHLHPSEVLKALGEFKRCLAPEGQAIVIVPDCEGVRPTFETLFTSESGLPISGHDLFFGHSLTTLARPYMRHQIAFIRATLIAAIEAVGFTRFEVKRLRDYNLLAVVAP